MGQSTQSHTLRKTLHENPNHHMHEVCTYISPDRQDNTHVTIKRGSKYRVRKLLCIAAALFPKFYCGRLDSAMLFMAITVVGTHFHTEFVACRMKILFRVKMQTGKKRCLFRQRQMGGPGVTLRSKKICKMLTFFVQENCNFASMYVIWYEHFKAWTVTPFLRVECND